MNTECGKNAQTQLAFVLLVMQKTCELFFCNSPFYYPAKYCGGISHGVEREREREP